MTKYYVDENGIYENMGAFVNAEPPTGAIEVPYPPDHAWQKWDFDNQGWLPLTDDQKQKLNIE